MSDMKKLMQLKNLVDSLEKEFSQLVGSRNEILSQIKEEFDIDNIRDLRDKQGELIEKRDSLQKELSEKLNGIEEKLNNMGVSL